MSYAQDVLMSTERVAEHLDDDSIRIVDVDEDPAVHSEAHIPGAIGLNRKTALQDQVRRDFIGLEGRETSAAEAPDYPRATFTARPGDDSIRAFRDEVLAAIGSPARLVGVRSPQEYSGELVAMPG